jgi:hypothetical protein
MAEVVEQCLLSKYEALSSYHSTATKKRKKKERKDLPIA